MGRNRGRVAAFILMTCAIGAPGAAAEELLGSAWIVEAIGGEGVAEGVRSTLEFLEPGRVAGTGGCNRYFAAVTLGGDTVAFGNVASTRMMCPGAPMDQEQRFFQALGTARRLSLDDGGAVLRVYAADGTPILRLGRIVEK